MADWPAAHHRKTCFFRRILILILFIADQKARAKLSADLEAEAFRRSLEQARIEVGPIGGPNITKIIGSPYVHDMTHMLANANTQKNTQAAKRGSAAPPASPTETPS